MTLYDVGSKVTIRGRFGTGQTVLLAESAANATAVTVADVSAFGASDKVVVNPGLDTEELNTVATITGRVIGFTSAFIHPHHIRENLWERTDPTTVTLKVIGPSGATDSYTYAGGDLTQDSAGVYSKDLSLSSAGTYYYKWYGTGAAEAAGEGQFSVRTSQFAT